MSPEEQQQVYQANLMEATRAQRTDNADKNAHWFAMFMVEKTRADKAAARVNELEAKYEVKKKK